MCTVAGGHYTTYALNYVNLTWYEYDDQIVTEVDAQQVENCEAYVLFYRFCVLPSQFDEVLESSCCITTTTTTIL